MILVMITKGNCAGGTYHFAEIEEAENFIAETGYDDVRVVEGEELGLVINHKPKKVSIQRQKRKPGKIVRQEDTRHVFGVGQEVLVRLVNDWRTREILGITVRRDEITCPYCQGFLLGEPRFWFKDQGNVPLSEIIAKEDIDPGMVGSVAKLGD